MSRLAIRWGFRVATRPEDGWGHIVRCRSLADAMLQKPAFYIDPNPRWSAQLKAEGFEVRVEPTAGDAKALEDDLGISVDAGLLDGYAFADRAASLAGKAFTAQIVDFPGRRGTPFVIAPGIGAEAAGYGGAECIAGAAFALLRSEFAEAHRHALRNESSGPVRRLLIAFGGRDSTNATGLALDVVGDLPDEIETVVAIASDAPHRAEVERKARDVDAEILVDVEDMALLYLQCDLAIGASGMSLAERMCCGLPSALVVQAENQMPNAQAAHALRAARFLGVQGSLDADTIAHELRSLCRDHAARSAIRKRGLELVDGRGAERAALRLQQAAQRHHVNSLSL